MQSQPKIVTSSSVDEDEGTVRQFSVKLLTKTKALSKEARTYELEKFRKNCLIIFNQEYFEGFYVPRLGTTQDVEALKATFRVYGFEIVMYKDLSKKEIMEVLDKFKTNDFTDYGCVFIAVLTHGSFDGLLHAKDQQYNESEIYDYFSVHDKPTLVTKPKVLIIQACRGTEHAKGVPVLHMQSSQIERDLEEVEEPYTLPAMADTLIVHSSYVGQPSFRNRFRGTWFIQTLCRKINELAISHDLESILIEVKREVGIDMHMEDYNRKTGKKEIYKQMPTVRSTLIRKLYLRNFGDKCPLTTFLDSAGTSRNTALDSTPTTSMLLQFGPCFCFLDYFDYIKKCLLMYSDANPSDVTAKSFLEISNSYENVNYFDAAKEKLAKAICVHLMNNAKHCDFYSCLYFYKYQ